jgi:hypothetical protein
VDADNGLYSVSASNAAGLSGPPQSASIGNTSNAIKNYYTLSHTKIGSNTRTTPVDKLKYDENYYTGIPGMLRTYNDVESTERNSIT